MSVVNVKYDDGYDQNELSLDSYTAKRRYTVLLSAAAAGNDITARQATGVPRIGDGISGTSLICTKLPTKAVGNSRTLFEVIAEYEVPKPGGGNQGSTTGNPLDEPAEIRWGSSQSVANVDVDIHGTPITNSADEPFDPPPTQDIDDPVLYITRNEASFDPNILVTYRGAVNSDTFYGAPAGEARMIDLGAQRVIVGTTVAYWKVNYAIQFRRVHPNTTADKAWWLRQLNQGYRQKTSNGPPPVYDPADGQTQTASPIFLTTAGLKTNAAGANWLTFEIYRSVAFAPLGL